MDQLLSQIIPSHRIGDDGFNWWVGQIESTADDDPDNKGGYRFKVRIVGEHPQSKDILSTENLPWVNVMMPVTAPFMPGNTGGASVMLEPGCWVVGFYLDPEKQKPIIMGSIGQTPGATTVVNLERPDNLPFVTAISSKVNPAKDGKPAPENTEGGASDETNKSTGGLPSGAKDSQGKDKVPVIPRTVAPLKKGTPQSEEWCQEVADKCGPKDMKTNATRLLGEFLAEVQGNGGNIGTYLVNQSTGGLYNSIAVARRYVNKFMGLIRHFLAKIKGFIIEKLTAAVKDLISALLSPSEEGNVLTPVTEWFNNLLKDLGCQMADLGERLEEWLTNILIGYLNQIYRAVACQVDELVGGILSRINSLLDELLQSVLGPLQDILGAVAAPLNIIGGAINYVLDLLGICCSGPNLECSEYDSVCTDGDQNEARDRDDFLDDLLAGLDDLFPSTGADYSIYTCAEAYTGSPIAPTTVGFVGGVPASSTATSGNTIVYDISDITVTEGNDAVFTVTRSGYIGIISSITFRTIPGVGTAVDGSDYIGVNSILGFLPGEASKQITVQTLSTPSVLEPTEDFYLRIDENSPSASSGYTVSFTRNLARCDILDSGSTPAAPGSSPTTSPITPTAVAPGSLIPTVFSGASGASPSPGSPSPSPIPAGGSSTTGSTSTFSVTANRSTAREGDFIVYTITTTGVGDGTSGSYTLSGPSITSGDIVGGSLTGTFTITGGTASVTIGIEDDIVPEGVEILRFTVNGTGAFYNVAIDASDTVVTGGTFTTTPPPSTPFRPPTVTPTRIITNPTGGIISIPISNPGSPWAEPPYVTIGGAGIGATATALLDSRGFLTEIRVKSAGYGYKKNLAVDNGVRCIIDTFTLIRPGIGYTSEPDVYVNGELGIAEAIINEDGFVIGARILDRERVFDSLPQVRVIGGGGYGAKLIASLACLDTQALSTIGATKIGTGRYVDCP